MIKEGNSVVFLCLFLFVCFFFNDKKSKKANSNVRWFLIGLNVPTFKVCVLKTTRKLKLGVNDISYYYSNSKFAHHDV